MTTSSRLSREQILALPPVITLAQLAQVLDVSEPTVRAAHRRDELEAMGIRVVKLGQQWRVVTSSVWAFLGLTDSTSNVQPPGEDTGQNGPASHAVRFLAPVRDTG